MASMAEARGPGGGITAVLGPTNTGKTHLAVERMLAHRSGAIGLPLRLLAREIYDRITSRIGERRVALVTGEEKRVPARPDYWVCTVESMPTDREVDFVCVDEIQLATHRQRGHTFTDRMLHARGVLETWFLGADTMRPMVEQLLPTAEIRTQPRFSKLSYSGAHGIGALPPRTAVVAFSANEVYELAERVRHHHGGTAVVLGALSPRTRNAQVAMYEAGEVQYMVATDAIGMGLNLDLDRVVFASLDKFDGKEQRELDDAEMAQIAGRAGRYTRDGEFGVLKPIPTLHPRRIQAIEGSRLRPVRRVVWRNSDLDFSSIETLVESLRARPRRPILQLVQQADDYDALLALVRRDAVRTRATNSETVELLWDVCRIPDFRKLFLDSHVELLARIFEQLAGSSGRLDPDWMARRIARLEEVGGDIDTLMNRIAFIRTWTYITHHERWVPDAKHWQERTREIEDRQSDALHRRLTERFVAREASGPAPTRGRRRSPPPRHETTRPPDPAHPFGALADLELPVAPGEAEGPSEVQWAQALSDAPHEAFNLSENGRAIEYRDEEVARLRRGADLLHPEVHTGHLDAGAGVQKRVQRRVTAWLRDAVHELVGPALALREGLSGAGRGLAYQLVQGLGTVDAKAAREQMRGLTANDRSTFEAAGIRVGHSGLHVPGSTRPHAVRLRAALWSTFREPPSRPAPPKPGRVSTRVDSEVDRSFYPNVGYLVRGPIAVRFEQLERVVAELEGLAAPAMPFSVPPHIGSWLGCRSSQLPAVMGSLGFSRVHKGEKRTGDRYARAGRPKSRRQRM